MRSDTRARPAATVDAGRDPTRAAALQRLASATEDPPEPVAAPHRAEAASATEPPAASPGVAAPAAAARPDSPGDTSPGASQSVASPTPGSPTPQPLLPTAPWAVPDPAGERPERRAPAETDLAAWEDPPWWRRIRWAPDRLAGVALVVLVVALGAFSVHRLLSTVPDGAPVPELPLATPGVTAPAGQTPAENNARATTEPDTPPAADRAVEEELVVSVVGMVGRSGLVTLAPGARVADALDQAGGVLDGGDRDGLNLARKLVDGEQILVGVAPGPDGPRGPRSDIVGPGPDPSGSPGAGAPVEGGAVPGAGDQGGGLVNLNTADAAALDALPGVGPVTASSILAWRAANGAFGSVDQLAEVDGIGPATLARLRPLVTV